MRVKKKVKKCLNCKNAVTGTWDTLCTECQKKYKPKKCWKKVILCKQ